MSEYSPITDEDNWFIGEKKFIDFTIIKEDGNAANITTWDLEWTLRQAPGATTHMLQKTSVLGGITKTDPTNGICRVSIDADDTLDLGIRGGRFSHALKRVDGANDAVLSFGEAVLKAAASR